MFSDINECVSNTHKCSHHAECINTLGSYKCKCKQGFRGTGFDCSGERLNQTWKQWISKIICIMYSFIDWYGCFWLNYTPPVMSLDWMYVSHYLKDPKYFNAWNYFCRINLKYNACVKFFTKLKCNNAPQENSEIIR